MTLTRLCLLAQKWTSDKTPLSYHGYTPYYSEILEGRSIKKILEIGIGYPETMHRDDYITGASLFMWQEYFPEAEIWAYEINPDILINEGNIKSVQCDQGNRNSLLNAISVSGGGFDLIIDDGSHKTEHQVFSTKILYPFLNEGGLYIIEDVWEPERVISQLPYKCGVKEFDTAKIGDDRLIVIRK